MTKDKKNDGLICPHGGELRLLLVDSSKKKEKLVQAQSLPRIFLSSIQISDVVMLGIGAYSPLKGFIGKDDYKGVLKDMRLKNGVLWPIPITLAVTSDEASRIKIGQEVALIDPDGDEVVAMMKVEEIFDYDKNEEAKYVYGTDDAKHPGVKKIYSQGDKYLAGPIEVLSECGYPEKFAEYARPAETRAIFAEKGWKTIAAFQTRNPIHRSHEYLTKIAMESFDGMLIHPVVGKLKEGDIPSDVRIDCYKVLLENYYPKDRVVLKVYPIEMRYGGPKEAVLHAIIRQNYGCTHMIIGRDHAGVGDYYGPFDAQKIFETFTNEDLCIKPLKADWTFWCYKCGSMASSRTCPHPNEDHLSISGTKLREMLSKKEKLPVEFSRPEVIEVLMKYYEK